MKSYTNFIGIDIGKFNFVVAIQDSKITHEYENTVAGIEEFLKKFKKELPNALCVLEPTGGHELRLLLTLCEKGITVHRAHTRKVKHFIQSYGNKAKTDRLDAIGLSLYGAERCDGLTEYKLPAEKSLQLYELVQRRRDLKKMVVAEKNRLQGPRISFIKSSIESMITILSKEITSITQEIDKLIEQDALLKTKKQILISIPGIGSITANELLVLLPELGQLSRREIAALVGLAPLAKDSGQLKGYRRTSYGREGIKPALFLAAMAARNSNSSLKEYYLGLLNRGKNKMVALVALMRKILVIANAKLKMAVAI